MKRRAFILTAVAAGAAVIFSIVFSWSRESKWKRMPFKYPLILSGFCDVEAIRNIGIIYRNLVPSENSKEKLLALLSNSIHVNQNLSYDDIMKASQLEMKAEEDFKKGKCMFVNGWLISETEGRQSALLSLS